ncbi:hypothetical protein CFIO01_02508 [Colletotrichum fioriniae PJ7]|uniref:Uncharacterized protein n=1 Tax=Colletotrichum fioriniae PJ7 TaxID=1445577 RepID=A0A010S3T7_9PEZI|nr:hypothetical protein CFIO01_02508 [Colletotrichum fioriniae PJ7]
MYSVRIPCSALLLLRLLAPETQQPAGSKFGSRREARQPNLGPIEWKHDDSSIVNESSYLPGRVWVGDGKKVPDRAILSPPDYTEYAVYVRYPVTFVHLPVFMFSVSIRFFDPRELRGTRTHIQTEPNIRSRSRSRTSAAKQPLPDLVHLKVPDVLAWTKVTRAVLSFTRAHPLSIPPLPPDLFLLLLLPLRPSQSRYQPGNSDDRPSDSKVAIPLGQKGTFTLPNNSTSNPPLCNPISTTSGGPSHPHPHHSHSLPESKNHHASTHPHIHTHTSPLLSHNTDKERKTARRTDRAHATTFEASNTYLSDHRRQAPASARPPIANSPCIRGLERPRALCTTATTYLFPLLYVPWSSAYLPTLPYCPPPPPQPPELVASLPGLAAPYCFASWCFLLLSACLDRVRALRAGLTRNPFCRSSFRGWFFPLLQDLHRQFSLISSSPPPSIINQLLFSGPDAPAPPLRRRQHLQTSPPPPPPPPTSPPFPAQPSLVSKSLLDNFFADSSSSLSRQRIQATDTPKPVLRMR